MQINCYCCCCCWYINPLTPTVAIWVQQLKHPVPDQVKPSLVSFDVRALWRSGLSVIVPADAKNYKWWLIGTHVIYSMYVLKYPACTPMIRRCPQLCSIPSLFSGLVEISFTDWLIDWLMFCCLIITILFFALRSLHRSSIRCVFINFAELHTLLCCVRGACSIQAETHFMRKIERRSSTSSVAVPQLTKLTWVDLSDHSYTDWLYIVHCSTSDCCCCLNNTGYVLHNWAAIMRQRILQPGHCYWHVLTL